MRLTWVHRVGLLLLGALALGGAITMSIMDLGGAAAIAGVIGLILPGFLVIAFAIVGVFPNVHLKDGSIDWAKIEPTGGYLPKAEFEQEREAVSTANAQVLGKLEQVNRRLENYILAHAPAPDDGMTDEDRLAAFQQDYQELEDEMHRRLKSGEDYDDGLSTEDFRKLKEEAHDILVKEDRRQWAQFEFGMRTTQPKSIYGF